MAVHYSHRKWEHVLLAIVSVELYGSIIGVSYALCGGSCDQKAVLASTV